MNSVIPKFSVAKALPLLRSRSIRTASLINPASKRKCIENSRVRHLSSRNLVLALATTEESPESSVEELPPFSSLDIRVGKILKCERHPDAESLYVEKIDVGEEEARTICSSLVSHITPEGLMEDLVIVLCNLKPVKLRGIPSHGMLLCASSTSGDDKTVDPLRAPNEAIPGERVFIGETIEAEPSSINRVRRKKIWDKLQPLFKTDGSGVANFDGNPLKVSSGFVKSKLANSPIN